MEWHDLELSCALEWTRSIRRACLELWLNLAGEGVIKCGRQSVEFGPLTAGFCVSAADELRASRTLGPRHCFLTVGFSSAFLRSRLAAADGVLHPLVERFVLEEARAAGLMEFQRLTVEQERWTRQLPHPPTVQAARQLWYQGKVLQLLAEFLFLPRGEDELFCERQKRLARERVGRVVTLLQQCLAQPPSLDEIGREAACSPFYLSRIFSREMGMTIPQYIRKLRMERAAELLRSGKYNVTEAAMEVGYSSLSHFSRAFCQAMGCCPALYPLRPPAQRTG